MREKGKWNVEFELNAVGMEGEQRVRLLPFKGGIEN